MGRVKKSKKLKGLENELLEELESSEETEKEVVKQPPKIPFQAWFHKKLKQKKVKFWQDEPLLVFMKKQGLAETDVEDSYDEALKRF